MRANQLHHTVRNQNWSIIQSRKYIKGTQVVLTTHGRRYLGEILYRYVTINHNKHGEWRNGATAVLCDDNKVRTTQGVLGGPSLHLL